MTIADYSSADFEKKYTYHADDLGALCRKEDTSFRLWAPTAKSVAVNLYRSGIPGADDLIASISMKQDVQGTWTADCSDDLRGVYYTYSVSFDRDRIESIDPYARACGVNGHRGLLLDLRETDPAGWDSDPVPQWGKSITDAVIYELHIRDLSMDPNSGITHKGKFLGLAETGTVTPGGHATGLDHIKNLGITHVHLLPIYDFGSVDESRPNLAQFNWGYDPMNYNIPEGSYATDPFHGEVRVKEMKQMVKALHDNGIGVILDVVYNHVFHTNAFCMNRIVPGYFSRQDAQGKLSNGSCCGNDTASERSMVRKYIVDSVCYWADEYHIDGFRFDLVGLIDVQTIQETISTVHKKHPHVIFYGEGWSMDTQLTKKDQPLATQQNAHLLPGFAFFSDQTRDVLKGSVFNSYDRGYVAGGLGLKGKVRDCFCARFDWTVDPTQVISYVSCHDNMTLFDKIVASTYGASQAEQIAMNNLAAAIYMLSQGVPFFQAGEEMLRSKPKSGGGFDSNSYKSSDKVNALKWGNLDKTEYQKVLSYYRGLIAFRKTHNVLRLTSADEVSRRVRMLPGTGANVLAFYLRGDQGRDLIVAFNPTHAQVSLPLPEGVWDICIWGERAGNKVLAQAVHDVKIPPISATALVLNSVSTRKTASGTK